MTVDSREITKVRSPMQPSRLGDSLQTFLLVCALALVAVPSGSAATGPSTPWTTKDMTMAVKAVGYPRLHARKVTCHGLGTADGIGRYLSFRCVALYARHRRARFYVGGLGEGGWLEAGKTPATERLLRKGFVPSATVATQGLAATADLAARGYMANRYGTYQAAGFCKQAGSSSWSCPFSMVTVTLTMKAAKGGYVTTASAA